MTAILLILTIVTIVLCMVKVQRLKAQSSQLDAEIERLRRETHPE